MAARVITLLALAMAACGAPEVDLPADVSGPPPGRPAAPTPSGRQSEAQEASRVSRALVADFQESYEACVEVANGFAACWQSIGADLASYCLKDERAALAGSHDRVKGRATDIEAAPAADRELLLVLAGLESRMCRLAVEPWGETLLTYRSKLSEIKDEVAALDARLRAARLDQPSAEGRPSSATRQSRQLSLEQAQRAEARERAEEQEERRREALAAAEDLLRDQPRAAHPPPSPPGRSSGAYTTAPPPVSSKPRHRAAEVQRARKEYLAVFEYANPAFARGGVAVRPACERLRGIRAVFEALGDDDDASGDAQRSFASAIEACLRGDGTAANLRLVDTWEALKQAQREMD